METGSSKKIGVLLLNLGTPEAPTPPMVRRYIRALLSDPRVVDAPRIIWLLVLNLLILPFRPKKSAKMYERIWTPEGSPLAVFSRCQQEKLDAAASKRGPIAVRSAMAIGEPSIPGALDAFEQDGIQRLLVLPLYPQYTSSSTGSAIEQVFSLLSRRRVIPELRTVVSFFDHPGYIKALAARVRACWEQNGRGEKLIVSYHGLPRKVISQGSPYAAQCCRTTELLAAELGLNKEDYIMCFQSRFGPGEWLRPYTADVLKELGRSKTRTVDIICPGFTADCLETLFEIAIEAREHFERHGGGELRYIPALNDSEEFLQALLDLVQTHTQGWRD